MFRNRLRSTGDVDVIAKQDLGINYVQQLYQRTSFAEVDVQRIRGFTGGIIRRAEKRVCQWGRSQGQETLKVLIPASPARILLAVNPRQ
jgi:hypothetical protein